MIDLLQLSYDYDYGGAELTGLYGVIFTILTTLGLAMLLIGPAY